MLVRRVLVGAISGVFGVAGQVKLRSFTEPPENLLRYRPWILVRDAGEKVIEQPVGRLHGKALVATIPGCTDRDLAAGLIGSEIWIERTQLPRPQQGQYYWSDLEGLEVVTVAEVVLGTVSHLFSTGANDVLV